MFLLLFLTRMLGSSGCISDWCFSVASWSAISVAFSVKWGKWHKCWHLDEKIRFWHNFLPNCVSSLLWSLGCFQSNIFCFPISCDLWKGQRELNGFSLAVFSILENYIIHFAYKSNYIVLEFSGKKITHFCLWSLCCRFKNVFLFSYC